MYRVIVVDDEQNIREGIQDLVDWEALQCQVVKAFKNGSQVIEYLEENKADIIVTDIKMPVVDGIMLAKHIHENELPLEVIFLTAFSDFSYAQKAIKYKVNDFVIKNNFLVELPQVINKVVDKLDSRSLDLKKIDNHNLKDVKGQYQLCIGEVRNGYKIDMLEKIAALEKIVKASLGDKDVFLFDNDEVSFYIIIENAHLFTGEQQVLERKLSKFTALAKEFLQLEIRLGVSAVMAPGDGIFKGKKQALHALAQIVNDREVISFYTGTDETQGLDELWDIDSYMRELLRVIKNKNAKEYQEKEAEYRNYLETTNKMIEQYKSDTHAIASYLLRKYHHLHPDQEPLLIKESIFETIYLAKSKAALIDIIEDVCQTMREFWEGETLHKNVLVNKVDEIIRNNYQSKLSLKEISQKLFVNGSYLSRVYKKETHDTITDAINKYRIQRAKELLDKEEYKIYEVGNLVGIDDPAYFTHIFYKYEGETPSYYMNRHKQ